MVGKGHAICFISENLNGCMKRFLKNKLYNLIFNLNLSIQKINDFERLIYLINKENNYERKNNLINKFIDKYPNHWLPYYKKLTFLHYNNLTKFLKYIDLYDHKNNNFYKQNLLINKNFEIIDSSVYFGSIGNFYALETLIKANLLGLRKQKKIIVLLPKNSKVNNKYLFNYFSKYFKIIYETEEDYLTYKSIEKKIFTPLGLILKIKNKSLQMDIASNYVENFVEKKNKKLNLLKIQPEHKNEGFNILKYNNIDINKWIVTLHIREPSYRGENIFNSKENFRTSDPLSYISACKKIIKEGGIVFRMGDNNMTKFPKIEGVIDYAHSSFRSEFMDIFLASQSRFCIGTASGFFRIPRYFGIPVLFTNSASYSPVYSLKKGDIFLPRMIKNIKKNSYVSFGKCLSPEIGLLWHDDQYKSKNLITISNSSEEIEAATKEIIDQIINNHKQKKNIHQKKFDYLANTKGKLYNNSKVKNLSTISKFFINKYAKNLKD